MSLPQMNLLQLAQLDGGGNGGLVWMIGGGVVLIIVLALIAIIISNFNLWLQAAFSGAPVGFGALVGMSMRKVDRRVITLNRIKAVKAGLHLTTDQMEAYYLNGGRVTVVVDALIAARFANIPLTWEQACAIDRAGRDILGAVQTSVNPKVIDCPDPRKGDDMIPAQSQDGIQLKVKARITVRTNIARLVGGATEETIIARVGQGIVSAVGQATTYREVLESPANISKVVLREGLDAGTAFEILSVDIADIVVGENVGARLQADQAEADKRRFQAEAEKRRALAVAQEQEFKAEEQKNRALVVLAESEVPRAIAEAFRSGNMGIMDYQRYRNIQADTSMRRSIAGESEGDGGKQRGS
jgi:uncharacterized protein YqfA (UPF0365 family)